MRNADRASEATPWVYVWDPFVRLFHWTLVAAFTVAYLAEDDRLNIHVWAGYIVGILVVARGIWGFVGSARARFSGFLYTPADTLRYLRDLLLFRAERHLGHKSRRRSHDRCCSRSWPRRGDRSRAYGGEHQVGPLAGMFTKDFAESFEEVHEVVANITLALVLAHVAAVVLASFVLHENRVRAMVTGYKRR